MDREVLRERRRLRVRIPMGPFTTTLLLHIDETVHTRDISEVKLSGGGLGSKRRRGT